MADERALEFTRGAIPELKLAQVGDVDLADLQADTLIVPVFNGNNGLELAGSLGGAAQQNQEIELWKLLVSVGTQGTVGEVTTVPAAPIFISSGLSTIVAVGLGDTEDITAETIREGAGNAIRALKPQRTQDDEEGQDAKGLSVVSTLGIFDAEAALIGHALGGYTYSGQKEATPAVERVTVLANLGEDSGTDAEELLHRATSIVTNVCLARDLVNAPANVLYPESYADLVVEAAAQAGLTTEVLDEKQLKEEGFGGIIGVGQGSARPPRLVRISYNEDKTDLPFLALVGKGITFDTGGISLKPGANMWNMISDMGGSAAVVGSILAIAQMGLDLRVTATIPLAENMPGDAATRPGDILRHYGGKTTEVLNTDAEGRLVLADAIARACEDEPDFLIETATLTGAQMVALGERTPGIMGSIDFRDRVSSLSQEVGENGWPMPLPLELGKALHSDVADLRNISNARWGGMSVAGHYLANFVAEGVQWVHIDVAGPAYNTSAPHGYTPKRGTGVPLRTIVATAEAIAAGAIAK